MPSKRNPRPSSDRHALLRRARGRGVIFEEVAGRERRNPLSFEADSKYPGWLGKMTDPTELTRAAMEATEKAIAANEIVVMSEDEWDEAFESYLEEAVAIHKTRAFLSLMVHFGIRGDDEQDMFKLARALAEKHVPAFKYFKKRGIHRLKPPSRRGPIKKPPGRPKLWGKRELQGVLDRLKNGQRILRAKGAKVTNFEALRAAIGDINTRFSQGKRAEQIESEARRDALRVADARRALQKCRE